MSLLSLGFTVELGGNVSSKPRKSVVEFLL